MAEYQTGFVLALGEGGRRVFYNLEFAVDAALGGEGSALVRDSASAFCTALLFRAY